MNQNINNKKCTYCTKRGKREYILDDRRPPLYSGEKLNSLRIKKIILGYGLEINKHTFVHINYCPMCGRKLV